MPRRNPSGGEDVRDRILSSAIKVFSQKGFFNSTVSEIARASGVADGTIYLYFKNKDDLLVSLFEEKMEEVVAEVRQRIAAGRGALQKLRIFIDNHLNLVVNDEGLMEVLQVEFRQRSHFLREYNPVEFFEYLDVISDILDEGMEEGIFQPDLNTKVARRVIFGAIDEMSRTYVLSKKSDYHPSVNTEEVCRILIKGLSVSGVGVKET